MNQDQHTYELIDLYLRGELIGEDLDLFKIKLREDEGFLRQVQLQKAIIQHVQQAREADLRTIFDKKKKRRGAIIPFNRRVLSVAAVILSITAFGMILKMFLPADLLSDQSTTTPQEEVLTQTEETPTVVDTMISNRPADEEEVEDEEVTVPEIAMVEDDEVPDQSVLSTDADDDISRLKEEEDLLDGRNIEAKKDQLLTTRQIIPMVYSFEVKAPAAASAEADVETVDETATKATKKEGDSKDTQKVAQANTERAEIANVPVQRPGTQVNVEYWRSIVNFTGYSYNGTKLKLFQVPPDARLKIVVYQNKTYLKWEGAFYQLLQTDEYETFVKVKDAEVLKVIGP
ncbi:MAG: hypothetical protein H6608_05400 [Flavobacteriales bacterium]|nr:hypothetical protein [Bacteroidota bacterium]MCB9240541.1 hypothetical protein [Flavobacteriales bacterium]